MALFELNGVDGVRAQGVRLAAGLVRNPLSATWLIMFNFDKDCWVSLPRGQPGSHATTECDGSIRTRVVGCGNGSPRSRDGSCDKIV